jgi:flagellar biosynthesis protein FlhG
LGRGLAELSRVGTGDAEILPTPEVTGPPEADVSGLPEVFEEIIPAGRCDPLGVGIASGKGGTGKTVLAVNLAVELASRGRQLVYMDADLGLANGHLLLGIEPLTDLRELVRRGKRVTFCLEDGPCGLGVMAGASGVARLADLQPAELRRLAERMEGHLDETEILVLDSAAGVSWQTLLLLHASNYVVLVTTPRLPAITDAYAVAKALFTRDPGRPLGIVLNRAGNRGEGEQAYERLTNVTWRFLGERPPLLGVIQEDPEVGRSVDESAPFVLENPEGEAAREVKAVTDALIGELGAEASRESGAFSTIPNSFPRRLRGLLQQRKRRW